MRCRPLIGCNKYSINTRSKPTIFAPLLSLNKRPKTQPGRTRLSAMTNELNVIAISSIMFFGAFSAMLLPGIKIQHSFSTTNLSNLGLAIEAIAAGMLCGSTLCIIMPEGFKSFFEASTTFPTWFASFSLLLGFVFMVILQAASDSWAREEDREALAEEDLDCQAEEGLSLINPASSHTHQDGIGRREGSQTKEQQRIASQALWGLVIHAAADGIAAGSASLSSSASLSVTVSIAIMLHKFPVAYSLSVFLRKSQLKGWELTRSLLLFSLSSPLFLLATFFLVGSLITFDQALVSLVILFSGGTVAYAAFMHVLPSTLKSSHSSHENGDRLSNTPTWVILAVVLSSFIPLVMVAILPED